MAWCIVGGLLVQILCESAYGRRINAVAFHRWAGKLWLSVCVAIAAAALAACQPTVKVEAPDKPIVINLNIKIEQEVRVKVDKEVEDLLKKQPDLF
jgi:hypothetical protein